VLGGSTGVAGTEDGMSRTAGLLILMLAACACVHAQSIDSARSRFLTSPNARSGTWAPYRLTVAGLADVETLTVRSEAQGVSLSRQVAVAGLSEVEVQIPVLVADDASLTVTVAESGTELHHSPTLPLRRVEADYARPYVAVFSTDPVYARGVLPSNPAGAICDYFELATFFTDWRMLDGYDAIVIFNPADTRLPEGSQRAIAEFCSLGGAALVAGSFRLGEQAVDPPAPAEPAVQIHRGVAVQRFGYGRGAIYRVASDELRRAPAQDVIVDALRDHLWFGAAEPPAGRKDSRTAPPGSPLGAAQPAGTPTPGPLFWGLAGALLLACGLGPLVAARLTRHPAAAPAGVLLLCGAIGALASLQPRPVATVEVSAIVFTGEGSAASTRLYIRDESQHVRHDLDDKSDRRLSRRLPGGGWQVDIPLTAAPSDRHAPVTLARGRVGAASFRDYATAARRGETDFSRHDARLLEWWLADNAWRGRSAELASIEWPESGIPPGEVRLVRLGAIRVTELRKLD